jgi:hypothetical protein
MLKLIRKTLHYFRKDGLGYTLIRVGKYIRRPWMRLLYTQFGRRRPVDVFSFETHMVDHCNLDCWGCSHFSPLADEWFAD